MTAVDPQQTVGPAIKYRQLTVNRSKLQIVLKLVAGILVLVPCGLIGYLFAPWTLYGMARLFSPEFSFSLGMYLFLGAFYYGMYSLVRWLFGESLGSRAVGLTCGSLATAYLVVLPFGMMLAAEAGWYEPRFNRGMDNYGAAFGISIISMPPVVVYSILAIAAWRSRSKTTKETANLRPSS